MFRPWERSSSSVHYEVASLRSEILAAFPEGVRLLLDDGAHPLTEDALMFAVKNIRSMRGIT